LHRPAEARRVGVAGRLRQVRQADLQIALRPLAAHRAEAAGVTAIAHEDAVAPLQIAVASVVGRERQQAEEPYRLAALLLLDAVPQLLLPDAPQNDVSGVARLLHPRGGQVDLARGPQGLPALTAEGVEDAAEPADVDQPLAALLLRQRRAVADHLVPGLLKLEVG